ncbi:monooxygenase 2 [Quercus suber]|uniref:Monooxygenase 2 n=1 Tax=Quercus suber TaxID=58331 RepID=A0AAW0M410_QUESU
MQSVAFGIAAARAAVEAETNVPTAFSLATIIALLDLLKLYANHAIEKDVQAMKAVVGEDALSCEDLRGNLSSKELTTPAISLSRKIFGMDTPLHPWELLWGNINKDNVCETGDALQPNDPMTPAIGQGGNRLEFLLMQGLLFSEWLLYACETKAKGLEDLERKGKGYPSFVYTVANWTY